MLSPRKEKAIIKRLSLLRYMPFIRLAVLSGSCATGEARDDSDIDLIIGAENGRVWLCRAFAILFCDVLGIRNKPSCAPSSANRLCLSHFMGLSDLKMSDPENFYEENLLPRLLPIYGKSAFCDAFLRVNARVIKNCPEYQKSSLYVGSGASWSTRLIEKLSSGKLGDLLESQARDFQFKKIRRYASGIHNKTRVITTPNRVETYYFVL